jgi:hypothetical protein
MGAFRHLANGFPKAISTVEIAYILDPAGQVLRAIRACLDRRFLQMISLTFSFQQPNRGVADQLLPLNMKSKERVWVRSSFICG